MKKRDVVALSLRSVRRGGVKYVLCVLAFCVGICSTCTVITLGGAASQAVSGEIDRIGIAGMAFYVSGSDYRVGTEDLALARSVDGVRAAMPLSFQLCSAWLKGAGGQAMLVGVGSESADIFNITLLHGRLPNERDIQSAALVAVIDDGLAWAGYSRTNVVGKRLSVWLNGSTVSLEIIGVIRSQKQGVEGLIGSEVPVFVYVPYTAADDISGQTSADKIAVAAFSGFNETEVAATLEHKLSSLTGFEFTHENLNQYAESLKSITSTVSLFAACVAGISIIVGGMGVMNSMISAVDSRVRDVGIYLALGARRRDILACFLMEAQVLCVAGAVLGVSMSAGLFRAASALFSLEMAVDWTVMALILPGAALCGTVFGILPALRAARLNPIDAMRET